MPFGSHFILQLYHYLAIMLKENGIRSFTLYNLNNLV